jgi:uncharacterized protein (TIGR02646 family)
MIKLAKLDEPEVLRQNSAAWTAILLHKIAIGESPTDHEKSRYRHSEIKEVLKHETHGKCAYCESYVLHVAFGDIEHIIPKSLQPVLTFEWSNLTLACDICNTAKGTAEGLVDPYISDPLDYFQFLGPMVFASPNNDTALLTERRLQLNRSELLERRSIALKGVSDQLVLIANARTPELRQTLRDDLVQNAANDQTEFAAFVRTFVKAMLPEIDPMPMPVAN